MSIAKLCQPIELILVDVDGVLTDGTIIFDNEGIEIKKFNIRDGLGIRLWQKAGGRFGIITGRNSHIVNLRALELGISIVRQGTDRKAQAAEEIAAELGSPPGNCATSVTTCPTCPRFVWPAWALPLPTRATKCARRPITSLRPPVAGGPFARPSKRFSRPRAAGMN